MYKCHPSAYRELSGSCQHLNPTRHCENLSHSGNWLGPTARNLNLLYLHNLHFVQMAREHRRQVLVTSGSDRLDQMPGYVWALASLSPPCFRDEYVQSPWQTTFTQPPKSA